MIRAFVESLAVIGPGLVCWRDAASILSSHRAYTPARIPNDTIVGIAEHRRTTPLIRLVLQVVRQLSTDSSIDMSAVTAVFATSWGDSQVVDNVLSTLAVPGSPVSPLQFHNIVHNTPAGYWSISAGARGVSTSLTAADSTVAAGLLDAFVCLTDNAVPVLLVCFDHPLPASWDRFHHIEAAFATAMVLTSKRTDRARCAMRLEVLEQEPESRMIDAQLEQLRVHNPAARALPLLSAIASGSGRIVLPSNIGGSSVVAYVEPLHRSYEPQSVFLENAW